MDSALRVEHRSTTPSVADEAEDTRSTTPEGVGGVTGESDLGGAENTGYT